MRFASKWLIPSEPTACPNGVEILLPETNSMEQRTCHPQGVTESISQSVSAFGSANSSQSPSSFLSYPPKNGVRVNMFISNFAQVAPQKYAHPVGRRLLRRTH